MARRLTTDAPVAVARVWVAATDWVSAVRSAAALLVEGGAATSHYADRCVGIVREQGPYIVIAPGIALAHARPEDGARHIGVGAAVLSTAVFFGHAKNDPVDVVFAFASPDKSAHLSLLAQLATGLTSGLADELRAATSDDEATAILKEAIGNEH